MVLSPVSPFLFCTTKFVVSRGLRVSLNVLITYDERVDFGVIVMAAVCSVQTLRVSPGIERVQMKGFLKAYRTLESVIGVPPILKPIDQASEKGETDFILFIDRVKLLGVAFGIPAEEAVVKLSAFPGLDVSTLLAAILEASVILDMNP